MKYFSIRELCKSDTAVRLGIGNTPDKASESRLVSLIENVLDPLREAWGSPLIVTSGYRSKALNRAVGGSVCSQHMLGEAADIRTLSDTPAENRRLFELAISLDLPFDQLIDEDGYNWIHVSYGGRCRGDILHL
jgi:hypothetical protein